MSKSIHFIEIINEDLARKEAPNRKTVVTGLRPRRHQFFTRNPNLKSDFKNSQGFLRYGQKLQNLGVFGRISETPGNF